MGITTFTSGTKAKASEVNTNFKKSFFQGEFGTTLNQGSFIVTTSATQILAANSFRLSALIKNMGTAIVTIGYTSGVTSTTGYPIFINDAKYIKSPEVVYAITNVGTAEIRFLEVQ